MKKNSLLRIIPLSSFLALAGCGGGGKQGEAIVHFVTGYQSIVVEDAKPKDGKVSKPTVEGGTVYGYYLDPSFTKEFDFSSSIDKETTIYIKMLKGEGTEASPYLIESGNSLNSLTHMGKEVSGHAKLTASFLTNSEATEDYRKTVFTGTMDGDGHRITLDWENDETIENTGLFNEIGLGGSVRNLAIEGHIKGAQASTGALANVNRGTIEGIVTSGTTYHATNGCNNGVSLMTKWDEDDPSLVVEDFGTVGKLSTLKKGGAGAIAGTNYGVIRDSVNKMNVQATIGAGSMAGINYGRIENCFNQGAIGTAGNNCVNSTMIRDHNFDYSYIGGIAGANYGTIHQCANLNQVFVARLPWLYNNGPAGQSDYIDRIRVGGIAGANFGEYEEGEGYTGGIVTECVNYGRIHGDMQVGGIAGYTSGYIADCMSVAFVGGRSCVGEVAGWMSGDKEGDKIAEIENCVALGRVVAGSNQTVVDEEGNTYTAEKLTNRSGTSLSNINEHYKIAKYATGCVYHNNSGNIDPVDAESGANTSISTTATMGQKVRDQVGFKHGSDTGIWAPYEDVEASTAAVPLASSWQVFLNNKLAWQAKTITAKHNGEVIKTVHGVAGIDYVNMKLNSSSSGGTATYSGLRDSNPSGYIPGRGLPTNPIRWEDDEKLIWVTREGDASSEWDGLLKEDITVYPMAVKA